MSMLDRLSGKAVLPALVLMLASVGHGQELDGTLYFLNSLAE
jgi:hypothetical protein